MSDFLVADWTFVHLELIVCSVGVGMQCVCAVGGALLFLQFFQLPVNAEAGTLSEVKGPFTYKLKLYKDI